MVDAKSFVEEKISITKHGATNWHEAGVEGRERVMKINLGLRGVFGQGGYRG